MKLFVFKYNFLNRDKKLDTYYTMLNCKESAQEVEMHHPIDGALWPNNSVTKVSITTDKS